MGHRRIWVRDTGIGIPPEQCNDELFERFFKIDEFTPGTGLGLSICRAMAHTLGAVVGFESQQGRGSIFWVEPKREE
jgi:signal transduction histidine kinase